MKAPASALERVRSLVRITGKELRHLQQTDARLFATPFEVDTVRSLESEPDLAERVEAFASRFGRLRDTLGDKLLPAVLALAGEAPATAVENLDRAEKLGWLPSADEWLGLRRLRNLMVHEYMEAPHVFADALNTAHEAVPMLATVTQVLADQARSLTERG